MLRLLNYFFFTEGLGPVFKWNFVEFSVDFLKLENFLMTCCHLGLVIHFSNGF